MAEKSSRRPKQARGLRGEYDAQPSSEAMPKHAILGNAYPGGESLAFLPLVDASDARTYWVTWIISCTNRPMHARHPVQETSDVVDQQPRANQGREEMLASESFSKT